MKKEVFVCVPIMKFLSKLFSKQKKVLLPTGAEGTAQVNQVLWCQWITAEGCGKGRIRLLSLLGL